MMYTLIVGCVLYAAVVLFFIYFCLYADPRKSATSRYLLYTLPEKISRLLGQRCLSVLEFINQRALVLIYCFVTFGTWSIVFFYAYPLINEQDYVSSYHKYIGYMGFASCVISWRYAMTTNPGIITKTNIQRYDHFPYDHLLFTPDRICSTTGVRRLARSKYDRFKYKQNVARFDHYCGWVYNSIGEENYRFFLLFLLVHAGICIYGSIILSLLLYGQTLEQGLFQKTFFNSITGEEIHADKFVIFYYLISKHQCIAWILTLQIVMGIALSLFLCYHIWLTSRGMTTNESYKWGDVNKWYKMELKRYNDAVKNGEIIQNKDEKNRAVVVGDGDVTCTPTQGYTESSTQKSSKNEDALDNNAPFDPGPKAVNIYNRGFVENWKEVIFPISLRNDQPIAGKPKLI